MIMNWYEKIEIVKKSFKASIHGKLSASRSRSFSFFLLTQSIAKFKMLLTKILFVNHFAVRTTPRRRLPKSVNWIELHSGIQNILSNHSRITAKVDRKFYYGNAINRKTPNPFSPKKEQKLSYWMKHTVSWMNLCSSRFLMACAVSHSNTR